jgi:hypothetical protein
VPRARSERFIIHVLDDCNLLVQPHMVDEIKARRPRLQGRLPCSSLISLYR